MTVAVLGTTTSATAERRLFTQGYEFGTTPEDKTTVELWHTQTHATWTGRSPETFEQVIRLAHGLADRWELAIDTTFVQVDAVDATEQRAFGLDSLRADTSYRLADKNDWPVDIAIYAEGGKQFGTSEYVAEGRVIASRDFDRMTVVANAIAHVDFGHAVGTTLSTGWTVGASYELHPKLNLGAETWGVRADGVTDASVGPALSFAPSANFWLAVTGGAGITDAAPSFTFRAIVGIEL